MQLIVFVNSRGEFRLFNYNILTFLMDLQITTYTTDTVIYYTVFLQASCTKKHGGPLNYNQSTEVLSGSKMMCNRVVKCSAIINTLKSNFMAISVMVNSNIVPNMEIQNCQTMSLVLKHSETINNEVSTHNVCITWCQTDLSL